MREVVVLGTSSAVPTRTRNHVGLVLRFDGSNVLVDPGENTQRQLLLAGVSPASIDAVWLTHVHGDHCFGLPGFLQRRAVDGAAPVTLVHPAAGDAVVDGLLAASGAGHVGTRIRLEGPGESMALTSSLTLDAVPLEHRVPTFGVRLRESDGLRVDAVAAARLGVVGPLVGELMRAGEVLVDGRRVRRDEVTEPRPGQRVAVVMDTVACPGAEQLAEACDLLITESTFLAAEQHLARDYRHLTARDAGDLARCGGASTLVLQHYSQRYADERAFAREARAARGDGGDVIAAVDLQRVPVPSRRVREGPHCFV